MVAPQSGQPTIEKVLLLNAACNSSVTVAALYLCMHVTFARPHLCSFDFQLFAGCR
jgi:hypothetical protein